MCGNGIVKTYICDLIVWHGCFASRLNKAPLMVMVALFTKCHLGGKVKADEMVGESRLYVGLYEMFTEFFLVNPDL